VSGKKKVCSRGNGQQTHDREERIDPYPSLRRIHQKEWEEKGGTRVVHSGQILVERRGIGNWPGIKTSRPLDKSDLFWEDNFGVGEISYSGKVRA